MTSITVINNVTLDCDTDSDSDDESISIQRIASSQEVGIFDIFLMRNGTQAPTAIPIASNIVVTTFSTQTTSTQKLMELLAFKHSHAYFKSLKMHNPNPDSAVDISNGLIIGSDTDTSTPLTRFDTIDPILRAGWLEY